jgi:serine/threonine-protein kinase
MTDVLDRLKTALADRYAIERELGAGGMATVYLAHDIKHDRKVAIKVMRPELSAILGGERFLREVSIAAKLNHPHILALHDSGEAERFLYYVMPYVEGESLRDKLNREKQLSVDEAIAIIKQVGAALDYAHEQGVIHRDIKPENILMYQGEALVADFGIALAVSAAGGTRLTDTGLSLGTPEYMSPEQATGERELDARSDVYSLGAITYEMLVGEPPHTGKTVQAIIAKVVSAEPQPVSRVRHSVPSNVDAAVMCALAKTPADRFGSGVEFVGALNNPAFVVPSMTAFASPTQREGLWQRVAIGLAALAALLAVSTLWALLRSRTQDVESVTRFNIEMPEGEEIISTYGREIALSPDGRRLVYVGQGQRLWTRPLDSLHARLLTGTDGARGPFFSSDGQTVGFIHSDNNSLQVVPVAGGPPQTIVDRASVHAGGWGRDGMVYFGSTGGGISRVSPTGGEPEVLTMPDTSADEVHYGAQTLPNGKGALFVVWRGQLEDAYIAVVEFGTGEVRELVRGFHPLYAMSGHLVFVRSDSMLMAAPFDQNEMQLTGPATTLSEKVMVDREGAAEVALSETGTLLYRTGGFRNPTQPMWVDRDGVEREMDPDWIGNMWYPSLSPDGTHLTMSIDGPNNQRDIWIKTLDRGPLRRFTFSGFNQPSVWTPDGRFVTYGHSDVASGRNSDIWQKRADGLGPATLILDLDESIQGITWSTDGRWLIFTTHIAGDGWDVHAIRPDIDSIPTPLVTTDFNERSPALSPDGRWLTYTSDRSGQYEVYVRPFPDVAAGIWQVSTSGGRAPIWARNGRELFYVNGNRDLVVVELRADSTFAWGPEKVLFSGTGYRLHTLWNQDFAVSHDDQWFVIHKSVDVGNQGTTIVFNFFEELRQRVGNGDD